MGVLILIFIWEWLLSLEGGMSDSLLGYEFLSAQNLRCKKLLVIGHW